MVTTERDIDLNVALAEYTKSLNPLCRRIVLEKQNLASLYGSQWKEFSLEDQDMYIDEHFIPRYVQDKYKRISCPSSDESGAESFPRLKIKPGQRIIEDQEGDMWQDEHSGPFSWETGSQCEIDFDAPIDTKTNKKCDPKRPKSPRLVRAPSLPDGATGALDGSEQSNFQTLRSLWEAHHLPTGEFYMARLITPQTSRTASSLEERENTTPDRIPSQAGLKSINLTDEVKFQERTLETIADISAAEEANQALLGSSTQPKINPSTTSRFTTKINPQSDPQPITSTNTTSSRTADISTTELKVSLKDAPSSGVKTTPATSNVPSGKSKAPSAPTNVTSTKSKVPSAPTNAISVKSNVKSSSVTASEEGEGELLRARPVIINTDDIELKITEESDQVDDADQRTANTSFSSQPSASRSSGAAPLAEPEEDILAKFGVTFSHGLKSTPKPPEPANQETESGEAGQSEEKAGALGDVMSFLADW